MTRRPLALLLLNFCFISPSFSSVEKSSPISSQKSKKVVKVKGSKISSSKIKAQQVKKAAQPQKAKTRTKISSTKKPFNQKQEWRSKPKATQKLQILHRPFNAKLHAEKEKRVYKWVRVFQKNKDSYFNSWLAKAYSKIPRIQNILVRQGLPEDLAYLTLIESGLNAKAKSHANAVGYWQFMKPTALQYGLKIDWWLDERHDMIKSTWAAGKYLKFLYKKFNNWHLALAAYNMGENRLEKLIKKHRDSNFWTLSKKRGFPPESKEYIPKFLAARLIAKKPWKYGFFKIKRLERPTYSYQYVPGGTDLAKIATALKIKKKKLTTLNPELKANMVPKSVNSHRIRVPKGFKEKLSLYFSKDVR